MTPPAAPRAPLPSLGSVATRTVHADVASRLRQAILQGELAAGTRLVQADLAAALEVSVTPVREALRGLASEGLVDFDAFRGAVVHTPTLAEMDEIYSIRCALTPLAVERAVAAVDGDDLELARSLCAQMSASSDPATWVELNRRFHGVLDAAAHSPHLSGVLARLADISVLYVNLSLGPGASGERRDDADDDHQRLVAAYAAKDVAAASGIAVAHLTRTIDAVRRAFLARSTASDEPRGAPHRAHTTATARVAEEQLR